MKRLTLLKHSAFATLLLSTAITAFAGGVEVVPQDRGTTHP